MTQSTNNSEKEGIEKTYQKFIEAVDENLIKNEEYAHLIKEVFEKLKHYKINSFKSLFNVCLYATLTNADLMLLIEKFRLSKRNYEKSLFSRLIALSIIEFIDDINVLLGRDLTKELTNKNFIEFIPIFKRINKKYSEIKKNHESLLRKIRNNTIAHKSKDSLKLINYIYDLDTEQIYELGEEVFFITNSLTVETVKVLQKILALVEVGTKNSS